MKYKKIELTQSGKINQRKTKTLGAVSKACSSIKKNFSSGTNNMADLWIKSEKNKKSQKMKMLKTQSISMFKNITSDMKNSFKGITAKGVICDISYELGGILKNAKETYHEYIDDITRIQNGK